MLDDIDESDIVMDSITDKIDKLLGKHIDLMIEDVIAEINERKRREANVILLGITESNKATGQERLEDDRAALSTILPPDLSAKIPNVKTTSVGEARTILKTKNLRSN
nr:uncharacterized protein LOC118681172 isoform X2 [Bactrocera oleae]